MLKRFSIFGGYSFEDHLYNVDVRSDQLLEIYFIDLRFLSYIFMHSHIYITLGSNMNCDIF